MRLIGTPTPERNALIMTRGLPASGKSTWAAKYVLERKPGEVVRVNKDLLRTMLHADRWKGSKTERWVVMARDLLVDRFLFEGRTVIVDDTNIQPEHEPALREIALNRDADFLVADFTDVSLDSCIKNDLKRPVSVGESVIREMHSKFLAPRPVRPEWDPNKNDAIIVDVDGTLAHKGGGRGWYDYDKVHLDDIDDAIREIVQRYHEAGYWVIVCSGRDDSCAELTAGWLAANRVPFDKLLMRKTGDLRKDSIAKEEIFREHIEPYYNIRLVLDDRNQVVDMWRSLGLKTLQCAPGNF